MTMKYTYEFKRQIVDDYLAHRGGVLALAKKYGVPAKSLVRQWIAAYRESGDAGLKASWTKEAYSEEFKRKAVERYLSSPDSYETLAQSRDAEPLGAGVSVAGDGRVETKEARTAEERNKESEACFCSI